MDGLQFKIYNTTQQTWVWIDAYTEYGAMMGDGFLDSLLAPLTLKPFVENQSRLIDGKRVVAVNPRKDSRFLNLTFDLSGSSPTDFKSKKDKFYNLLYQGEVTMRFTTPDKGTKPTDEIFHLIYKDKVSYAQNLNQTSCKIAVKFEEPNPSNRS